MGFLQSIYDFFLEWASWAIKTIWSLIVDSLVSIFGYIPDPCCVAEAVSLIQWLSNALHSGGVFSWLAWLFSLVEFEFGFRIFICVLIARFILRRLPVIG